MSLALEHRQVTVAAVVAGWNTLPWSLRAWKLKRNSEMNNIFVLKAHKFKQLKKSIYLLALLGVAAAMLPSMAAAEEEGAVVPWTDVAALAVDGKGHSQEKNWCRLESRDL